MNLSEQNTTVLNALLKVEHISIAQKLGLIQKIENKIENSLLIKAIGMINELSRTNEEDARKIVVITSAILWTYKEENWEGLKEFLIMALCRVGFSPSSIMIDTKFNKEEGTFSGIDSLINQLTITIHQLNHEIFIGNKKFLITSFQKNVWNKLSEVKLLGISAPTSAGKSFIILLKSIDLILKHGGNVIYIVPTLSLVAQVSADFNEQLKIFNLNQYRICTTYNSEDGEQCKIYVLTQEKAISAFTQSDTPFKNIRVLIIDEIQNIERAPFDDDQRSKTLYDTLIEFRHSANPDLTILSGPRVEGLKELGITIFDNQDADEEKAKDSPVASFTYAISKVGNTYFFNQYVDILKKPNTLPVTITNSIKGYGKVLYQDDFFTYLSGILANLGQNSRNIIFSPTSDQARNTAIKLAALNNRMINDEKTNSLVSYIKNTVHDKYDMCITIPRGFVYHHGKTPAHIRSVLEYAIRGKMIENVVCTTTLLQGVNLPAQNVIMRNPDLAIRARGGIKPKLSDYEIANLRGRAGRLLKDFIGRTFILEENSFDRSNEQKELFPEAEKILRCGYGEKYKKYKKQIHEGLSANTRQNSDNAEYGFLMTYIRQIILKHGSNSLQRLSSVGIDISENQFQEISDYLSAALIIPKEICYKNRYWDPLDLNQLYLARNQFDLPTSVAEDNIEGKLVIVLNKIKSEFFQYYKRYFDVSESLLFSACITAKEWMRERTLKEILDTPYFNTSDKIDDRISLIQKEISFGLPMLLKPIYDIKYPTYMFLRFIEIGAYMPITRKMIEVNIPRETAIYLNNTFFRDNVYDSDVIYERIINRLREIKGNVDYWMRIQFEDII